MKKNKIKKKKQETKFSQKMQRICRTTKNHLISRYLKVISFSLVPHRLPFPFHLPISLPSFHSFSFSPSHYSLPSHSFALFLFSPLSPIPSRSFPTVGISVRFKDMFPPFLWPCPPSLQFSSLTFFVLTSFPSLSF